MIITKDKTVAQAVTENIKASHVFKQHNIDFCCGGGITIGKACKKNNLDPNALITELQNLAVKSEDSNDYNNWDLSFLADYIVNIHHKYVSESIPILLVYATKVAKVHGHHYTEVVEIDRLFNEAAKDLSAHMMKEELILFPYIKHLVTSEKEESTPNATHFGTISNPINLMEDEHEAVGGIFKKIASLSNNYTPPENACNTFRALYDKLNEFEQDLHKHIHLENNILHPKALALSRKLTSNTN